MAGLNSFNVGRDGSQLTIIDTINGPVTFNGLVGFSTNARSKQLESENIDGRLRFRNVPAGHEGTFTFDRQDASVERYFAAWEANFYAGLPDPEIFLTQTVNELDGTKSQYQYSGVSLNLTSGGDWKGLDKVSQSVAWKASRKVPLVSGV